MNTIDEAPLTVAALIQAVSEAGGDVSAIYLGAGNPEDRYAIVSAHEGWQVYYTEIGQKLEFKTFRSESEACSYAMRLLRADDTVWRK